MQSPDLDGISDGLGRVCKRQKLDREQNIELVDGLIAAFENAKILMTAQGPSSVLGALADLKMAVRDAQEASGQIHKDTMTQLNAFGKQVDANFHALQLYKTPKWQPDPATCDLVISEHLCRNGLFDVADIFQGECQVGVPPEFQQLMKQMHQVIASLKNRELAPALQWATESMLQKCLNTSQRSRLTELLFQLHRLQVIDILTRGAKMEAIQYIRKELSDQFHNVAHGKDIRRLMSSVLWAGRLQTSPYADFLDAKNWDDACQRFAAVACAALSIPKASHLSVCLCAGYLAFPVLDKYFSLPPKFRGSKCDLLIPDMGPNLQFHSIFCCPVLMQVSSSINPPVLLPCQHVLSQTAVSSLVKAGRLKCPYCPTECLQNQCLVLHL